MWKRVCLNGKFCLDVIITSDSNIFVCSSILFYRDGVGDGQIQQVFDVEVKALVELLNESYLPTGQKPMFCFIIVNKRINTRIFTAGRPSNPVSGTVVDNTITLPER